MTTDFVMALPFGGAATLSIRPALNAQAVIGRDRSSMLLALGGLRSRAGGAAGAHARHPQRAGRRRHRHSAARQAAADGDPLAGRDRRRLLHRRHHVHPLDDQPGAARSRHRHGSDRRRGAEFRQRRVGRSADSPGRRSRDRRRPRAIRRSKRSRRRRACRSACRRCKSPSRIPTTSRGCKRAPVTAVAATPSLFQTLGIEIVRGRGFNDGDGPAARRRSSSASWRRGSCLDRPTRSGDRLMVRRGLPLMPRAVGRRRRPRHRRAVDLQRSARAGLPAAGAALRKRRSR